MTDWLLAMVTATITSPWVYLIVFVMAVLDAFLPVVPSETAVISAGVFAAAAGEPNLALIVAAAAAGAVVGDHASYTVGRLAAGRDSASRSSGRISVWARQAMAARGGSTLIVARFIPGGRTAVTLMAGTMGYPLRLFTRFDVVAGLAWATYCALIGFVGGTAFEGNMLLGVAFGVTLALTLTALSEGVRALLRRRRGPTTVVESAGLTAESDGEGDHLPIPAALGN